MNRPKNAQYAFLALVLMTLAGCVTTPQNVLKVACDRSIQYSTERCAKGIAEVYDVYQRRAEDLVTNLTTPAEVKQAIKTADAAASPVVAAVLGATKEYVIIRAQLAAGQTSDEKLAIANANLEAWVTQALPLIDNLVKAVGGKK